MRKKTEHRRQAILAVATQVFREMGFERATMTEICARSGGSKATLYSYFPSKEALFFEVMFLSVDADFDSNYRNLYPAIDDLPLALRNFGERMLNMLYSPSVLAARRLMVAESGRSALGQLCYARGPQQGAARMAEFLQLSMQAGKLRPADALTAAHHLRGLLEAELLDDFLFNLTKTRDQTEIKLIVERAITVFMLAYGPLVPLL